MILTNERYNPFKAKRSEASMLLQVWFDVMLLDGNSIRESRSRLIDDLYFLENIRKEAEKEEEKKKEKQQHKQKGLLPQLKMIKDNIMLSGTQGG